MNKEDIVMLYKYNQWSTAIILVTASKVTADEFLAPADFPHGGLRGTLVHALFAEWIWRNRWAGTSPTQRLQPEDFPTFDSLRTRWAEEEERLMSFVSTLTDERLNSVITYRNTQGVQHERVLWQMMAHEFQRRKRPTYTTVLLSTVTTVTKPQPVQCPNSRRMISCIIKSEVMPSMRPVNENQISSITSYQTGTSRQLPARC